MIGLVALAVLAGPLDAAQLEVIGFTDDGKAFGAVRISAGATEGWLSMVSVASGNPYPTRTKVPVKDGKAQLDPKLLETLKLGNDRGEEKFTKGTKLRAVIEAGGPLTVEILPDRPEEAASLVIGRGPWCRSGRAVESGTDHTLVSVLASRDGKSVAVVLKRTVEGARLYGFTAAKVNGHKAWCRAGEKPATEAETKACLTAVAKLPTFESTETTTDFEGGATMPRYVFGPDGVDHFSLIENPAVGQLFGGKIGACWKIDESLTLRLTDDQDTGFGTFDVQLVRTSAAEATLASTSEKAEDVIPGAATFVARPPKKKSK